MVIDEIDGRPRRAIRDLTLVDLPDNDVLVETAFSTLIYRDALAITGKGKIARRLPMVAGIDPSGRVVESRAPEWKLGGVEAWGRGPRLRCPSEHGGPDSRQSDPRPHRHPHQRIAHPSDGLRTEPESNDGVMDE
jgi:NADPH:quinone reductase-like Zn-dependent oxidoreductase